MEDELILVDFDDNVIGSSPKLEAHGRKLLHRAFSVFVFSGERLIIQKRAAGKYHSGGLWANTCCSHPRVGEDLIDAAFRRLEEEAGICCNLREAGSFVYISHFDSGLYEYELDHVFIGEYSGDVSPNKKEVEEMIAVDIAWLKNDLLNNPDQYAPWFFTALPIALAAREKRQRETEAESNLQCGQHY